MLPNLPTKGASFISTFFSTEVASLLSVNEITTKWFSLFFVSSTDQGGNSWTKLVIMRLITGLLDCRGTKNIRFAHHVVDKIIKGISFLKKSGAASVGEYNGVMN